MARTYMAAVKTAASGNIYNFEVIASNTKEAKNHVLAAAHNQFPASVISLVDMARLKKTGIPVSPVTIGESLFVVSPDFSVVKKSVSEVAETVKSKPKVAAKAKTNTKAQTKTGNWWKLDDPFPVSIMKDVAVARSHYEYKRSGGRY